MTKHKEFYEAPVTEVLEVRYEGVICFSTTMDGTFQEEDWLLIP